MQRGLLRAARYELPSDCRSECESVTCGQEPNVELSGAERSEGRQKRQLLAVRLNERLGTQANRKHAAAEANVTGGAKVKTNLNCAAPKLHCKPHSHRNALRQMTAGP